MALRGRLTISLMGLVACAPADADPSEGSSTGEPTPESTSTTSAPQSSEGGRTSEASSSATTMFTSEATGQGDLEGDEVSSEDDATTQVDDSEGDSGFEAGLPGCGFEAAAFCDDFESERSVAGPRSGELDPALWSVGRALPQLPTSFDGAFWIGPSAEVEDCRPDRDGTIVFPNDDVLVCEPNAAITSRHAWTSASAQNYGLTSHRARCPFDFTGRTGTISFDADLSAHPLFGWVSVAITRDPTPAPSFADFEYATGPAHGIELHFMGGECYEGQTGIAGINVFSDFEESVIPASGACVSTTPGHLNHVDIRISRDAVEIWATDPSNDGEAFPEPRLVASAELELPFERGWVNLTVHNHATIKYEHGPAWVARWDDFGFDGPVLPSPSEVSVPDALATFADEGAEGRFIGYPVYEPVAFTIPGVASTGLSRAELVLTAWYPLFEGESSSHGLRYRWNDGPWHERLLLPGELAGLLREGQQGTINQSIAVDTEALREGDNVLEIAAVGPESGYPAAVANVDLVLYRDGG